MNSTYRHIQHSPFHVLLWVASVLVFIAAWSVPQAAPSIGFAVVGLSMIFFALSFRTLEVMGEENELVVRYGPLNLFGTRLAYAKMTDVSVGKSSLIDGWGIHFIPLRGWTFNLWGFDCAVIHLGHKTIRIGSDDADNLVAFLNQRLDQLRTSFDRTTGSDSEDSAQHGDASQQQDETVNAGS